LASRNLGFLVTVALAVAQLAAAWEREPLSVYHERRARLVSETGDGVVVLFGYNDEDVAASVTTFHQNENFYYLTGWNEPTAMMQLVPSITKVHHQPVTLEKVILLLQL